MSRCAAEFTVNGGVRGGVHVNKTAGMFHIMAAGSGDGRETVIYALSQCLRRLITSPQRILVHRQTCNRYRKSSKSS